MKYSINLCGVISSTNETDCANGIMVSGKNRTSGETIAFGTCGGHNSTEEEEQSELMVAITGGTCPVLPGEFATTILYFKCGKTMGSPVYLDSYGCSVYFQWDSTEFCNGDLKLAVSEIPCSIVVNETKLVDLSPLTKQHGGYLVDSQNGRKFYINVCRDISPGGLYKVPGKSGADTYEYSLAVCADLGFSCGSDKSETVVCQRKPDNDDFHKQLGLQGHQTLRYSDGELTLIYKDGDPCHTHFRRQTIITFKCYTEAENDGIGKPIFLEDDNCTYFFEWSTKYACLDQPACRVEHGGQRFDLSSLMVESGNNWVAVSDGEGDNKQFYINVCHDVLQEGDAQGCPAGSAVCEIGELESGPVLVFSSSDYCFKQFEWHTAAACPLSHQQGSDCRVVDTQAGYSFDLSQLKKPQGYKVSNDAGTGNPEFVHEQGHTYNFKWLTAYACPTQPVECVAVDGSGTEYDLSSLSKSLEGENWVVLDDSDPANRRKFYINVCRPLNPVHGLTNGGCDTFAAACDTIVRGTGETVSHKNLGQVKGRPTVEKGRADYVSLVYTDGDLCASGGEGVRYTTTIHFICSKGQQVLWYTDAACALPDEEERVQATDLCMITDPNTNFTFNLQPLKKTGDGSDFYLVHSQDKTRQQTRVKIELACDREAGDEIAPRFVRQEREEYLFRLSTPLSCPPQPVDCVVQDSAGHQYDLTPLSKITGNWEVQDSRASHQNLRYHINVCRPINEIAGSTCPGGPVGGCQTGGQQAFGLGYIQSKPQVADDGTITLRYVGGTLCHRGTATQAHRSMRINFHCAASESAPVFVGESASCEYSFSWGTPSACPQQRTVGSDCKVVDPLYNYQFDLTPLHKSTGNYNVSGDGYIFLLNVCGALHSPPVECQNMGACQTGGILDSPFPVGKPNSTLIYDAGELSLVYGEGKNSCHGKYTRQSVLTFRCSQSETEPSPHYLQELGDCTYTFDWPTKLACPPHTIVDCTYTDDQGKFYDLSSLAHSDRNYVETAADGTKFLLNICRSLVHRKGETCPFNSAACMINITASDPQEKYQSLGQVSDNPVSMEEGKLVIRYNLGAPCSSGGTMSTFIVFSCNNDPDESQEGGPQPHFVRNNCEYGFVWETSAACPVTPQQPGQNCSITNPDTGYEFSLKSLNHPSGWEVNDREGHLFKINVCSPVSSTTCSSMTGSCQTEMNGEERSFSAGNANAQLEYRRDGVLLLNYSGGDVCHHNNVSRTTIISFICQKDAGKGRPVFVASSDGCLYYFDWHTSLACEQESGHYLAIPDEAPAKGSNVTTAGTYYINVCHPLNPVLGTLCPPGAAACRVQQGKPPQGLGQARSPPIYDANHKEVTMKYDNGWPCEWNSALNTSSRIIFRCRPGPQQGTPHLIEVSESCEYIFEWETNAVCPNDFVEAENSSCLYFDARTRATYNLSDLSRSLEVRDSHGGTFSVKACGSLSTVPAECQGAAVCLQGSSATSDGSYGKAASGVFEMQGEYLKLTFSGGRDCRSGGTASTVIMFECEYSAGKGMPVLLSSESCEVSFIWGTSLVCPPLVQNCALTAESTDGGTAVVVEYSHGIPACSSNRRRSNNQVAKSIIRLMCGDTVGSPRLVNNKENIQNCVFEFEWRSRTVCPKDSLPTELKDVNHVIQDPRSGGSFDLRPLLTGGSGHRGVRLGTCNTDAQAQIGLKDVKTAATDNTVIIFSRETACVNGAVENHKVQAGQYDYTINLEGHLHLPACSGATVCQLQHGTSNYHTLGTYTSRKYYLQEDKLEVVYSSPEKCTGRFHDKNVSTVITFNCKHDYKISQVQRSDPTFMYNTLDCVYVFSWDTAAACIQAKIAAAASRLKRLILCRRRIESQMQYSVLSQMEEDPQVDLPGRNPFEEDELEEEKELQNGDTVMVKSYHDDSDDDMLL
ncbi:hypothetical protein BaRGS_00014217 [Batillaria attramentaria]|uniref:MRH domain-containing protein n=1 Tax=Batillaria attramentaria TaxID=370345 RepID=A0ABD0L4T8_9CAEN